MVNCVLAPAKQSGSTSCEPCADVRVNTIVTLTTLPGGAGSEKRKREENLAGNLSEQETKLAKVALCKFKLAWDYPGCSGD